jgi:ABC-type sugar transport system ATPase subunit
VKDFNSNQIHETPTPDPSPQGGGAVPAASAHDVSKHFGATQALDGVDFDVMPGEIHALVGENGAGKSTLVRILGGVHRPDAGAVAVAGQTVHFSSPHDAIAAGIATIPQELRLVPGLSVAENIALGDWPVRRAFGILVIDRARMREIAGAQLAALDFAPDSDAVVGHLAFAERQLVAIAKALRRRCRLLILDEPTAALETREIERLFAVLERMKRQGTAIIYVSHRLDEVVALADRCTVLRDGRVAAQRPRGEFKAADLVQAMTGQASAETDIRSFTPGRLLLETEIVGVREREVIGLAGLLGSGVGAVLRRLFADPPAAIRAGIGMVPGERRLGLVMNLSVRDNILLPNLDRLTRGGRIDRAAGDRLVGDLIALVDIRPRDPALPAAALSGGNQQKVIIAKWLAREVGVLLLDEPTQGVDVAAKAQIHALIRDFAAKGGGVLVGSSDVAELTRICDAILALHRGAVAARLERAQGFDEKRLHAAMGG